MKKKIFVDQKELSDKQKENLYKWWKTQEGHPLICSSKESIYGIHEKKFCEWCDIKLDLGDLLEIVSKEGVLGGFLHDWIENDDMQPELIDALWNKVKHDFEAESE